MCTAWEGGRQGGREEGRGPTFKCNKNEAPPPVTEPVAEQANSEADEGWLGGVRGQSLPLYPHAIGLVS